MKKIIISIFLVLTILMTFIACDDKGDNHNKDSGSNSDQSAPTPGTEKTTYDILNELVSKSYSKVKLNVSTVTGGVELNAVYTLTNSEIIYSVEQLNLFPSDGNIENISPDYKVTLTGSATIENGKVGKFNGEAVSLPSYDELKGSFNFHESNFKNVVIQDNSLLADVISPSEFYGSEVNVQNMKINIEYSETVLTKITITYQTANSNVTTIYEFKS